MTNSALTSYVASFVDELVRSGVSEVVISPGSRSTPMALLMAEHKEMEVYVNIDERSAAYFALGIAKAKQQPVALLCTSGTASANYLPAIVEAYYSRVPLLVLTADRPHELRDVGAPQAIDQNQLFGIYAKWFVEMAIPEGTNEMIKYVRTVAGRAVGRALSAPAGPVHLNFPFREPLVPLLNQDGLFINGRRTGPQHVNVVIGKPTLSELDITYLYELIKNKTKGIIICGPQNDVEFASAVTKLAEMLNYPILADPLSQLRSGSHPQEMIINSYDSFLRNEEFSSRYKPELILRFGAMPVSKALLLYLKKHSEATQIVVDGDGGWRDPTLSATEMVYGNETEFCNSLISKLHEKEKSKWVEEWLQIDNITQTELMTITSDEELSEGRIFVELQDILPSESILFVGNSMPIRDLDTFFTGSKKEIRMMANRGANGIDGIISTALGVSLTNPKTVLVIGDLSFYHDLNGLLSAKQHHLNLTIVLVNNDGGGIFSFLPQSKEEKHFESLFGTPIGLNYEPVVSMYGGNFRSIHSWSEFRNEVIASLSSGKLDVIEVQTNRNDNVGMHRNLLNRVSQEISHALR